MIDPIQALQAIGPMAQADLSSVAAPVARPQAFADMIRDGVERVDAQLLQAETMTQAFALGGDVPIHQVTLALEQARLSFELMSQVRNRLVEGYQEIMRMQI